MYVNFCFLVKTFASKEAIIFILILACGTMKSLPGLGIRAVVVVAYNEVLKLCFMLVDLGVC